MVVDASTKRTTAGFLPTSKGAALPPVHLGPDSCIVRFFYFALPACGLLTPPLFFPSPPPLMRKKPSPSSAPLLATGDGSRNKSATAA